MYNSKCKLKIKGEKMIERMKYGKPNINAQNMGGNTRNVQNPRNTFKKEDLIPHTTDFKTRTKSLEELEKYRG
jgi:hypothetical protein